MMSESQNSNSVSTEVQSAYRKPVDERSRSVAEGSALRPAHQRILDSFIAFGTMTPDELAEKIERSVFYTRPRCSELRAMGLLHPTGEVRRNPESGLKASVLSI